MIQIDVTIMDHPYRMVCKEGEERALRQAVSYLDGKMTALRDSGKVKGNDRIAVMAALSIAAEFLSTRTPHGPLADMTILEVKEKIAAMHKVLDAALTPQENLF
jgi:cell division protein ZapA